MRRPLPCGSLMLEAYLHQLLGKFPEIEPGVWTASGCGRTFRLEVTVTIPLIHDVADAPGSSRPALNECSLDIIDVLKASERPLVKPKIIDALERSGKIWGESTIARALARLVKLGIILHPKHARTGYSMPEPLPNAC